METFVGLSVHVVSPFLSPLAPSRVAYLCAIYRCLTEHLFGHAGCIGVGSVSGVHYLQIKILQ